MNFWGLPQIKGSKKWQLLGRDFQVVFHRIKPVIVIYMFFIKTEAFPYKKKQKW